MKRLYCLKILQIWQCTQPFRCVQLFVTPWTVAHQAPLSRPRDQTCISWVSCLGRQILYHCTWEANITEKHFISQGKKKIYYLDTLLSKQTAPNMSLPNKGWWLKLKMGKTERKYWKFSCFAFHNPSHGEGCGSSGRQEEVNLVQLDWLQVGGI